MKKFVGIALVLALALSTAAMAEGTTDPVPAAEAPAVEAQVPGEEAADETSEAPATKDEQKALKDAMNAYRAAKQDKAVDDLEAELKGYVEAGSLTQEQADLILEVAKMSLWLGKELPEGWLWRRTTATAFTSRARLIIVRASIGVLVRVPFVSISQTITVLSFRRKIPQSSSWSIDINRSRR